ncbi:Phosphoglycerate kinase [Phytophthora fragariae]|uniref:Phosphoglycerate kinase n=2 Tax=Phytophthora fragariae TaxID=53985 RepID=A0A6G0NS72_9STRA|nr:Phosphoglycerate kinase [Phytophthora fragariae]KAE9220186.1 Phosphoglycerate kinase [Phytophthora fragariae]
MLRLSRMSLRAARPSSAVVRAMSTSKLSLEQLAQRQSLKGARVLVRADLNVPLKKNQTPATITDDTRIRAVLPTLKLLQGAGARTVLCSHLGRPGGEAKDELRLTPVAARLSELLGNPVKKLDDCIGPQVDAGIDALQDGEIMLLENVRFYKQETKNDPEFAKQLAHGADIYVNDAFGTAHRAHASTEGVTNYIETNVAGFLIEKELKYLSGAVDAPVRPLGAIIGGAKVSTKIPVLKSLLQKCDKILIGGGMIFTFYKAQGLDVGKSIIEEDKIELAKEILEEANQRGVQIVLPTDVVVADKFDADAQSKIVPANAIPADWLGLDIGPDSQATFAKELKECKTVVWNGPMGVFEFPEFAKGTFGVAKALAESTASGVTTIVGGGDSVAAVEQAGLGSKMSHISTGGGASLELLEGKVLPGVAALNDAYIRHELLASSGSGRL